MVLDAKAAQLLSQLRRLGSPPLHTLSPEDARRAQATGYMFFASKMPKVEVGSVVNSSIPTRRGSTPVRMYKPESRGPHPLFVFIHGGGWVLGDLDQYDDMCRRFCSLANCLVVSLDYGLAPEHKFPQPVDEVYDAICWLADHAQEIEGDSNRIAIGGDSAGGNLTAAVCLMIRDHGGPKVSLQLLLYPSTNLLGDTESKRLYSTGHFLEMPDMLWFRECYLKSPEDAQHQLASPLMAESLANMPPAFVITGECDPLRDEGEAYADRLRQDGAPAEVQRYEGMIHGFMSMTWVFEQGKEAIATASARLHNAFAE